MASGAETLNLSTVASTNLADNVGPVMPTSQFCHRRSGRSTNQSKNVVPLLYNNYLLFCQLMLFSYFSA